MKTLSHYVFPISPNQIEAMTWTFNFLPNYLRVTVEGPYTCEGQVRMFKEISLHSEWSSGMSILFDNRLLEMKNVNPIIIRQSVSVVQQFNNQYPLSRIGGLVNEGINFGFGRQFEILMELSGGNGFRLFKDERLALNWLLTKKN